MTSVIDMALDMVKDWKKYIFRIPIRREGCNVLKFELKTKTREI